MEVSVKERRGALDQGREGIKHVDEIILRNSTGMIVILSNYGATILSILTPDRHGVLEEVVLCAPYEELISSNSTKPKYVGTIGRVSNRIACGKFQLNEQEYTLAINNGVNHLHGGLKGFDKQVWDYELIKEANKVGVTFRLTSPDMEEGYPGTVQAKAEYCLTETNDLTMKFSAMTDKTTPISMTNHTFWNLSGAYRSSIKTHTLHLSCGGYLPIDAGLIPLGSIASVEDTPFDFTTPRLLGSAIDQITHNGVSGIDHSFVSSNHVVSPNRLNHIATLTDPQSGRQLIISSNQPAIQVYTGNFLPIIQDENSTDPFRQHHGVCLENQGFPNAVNESNFPSILLHPEEEYIHEAVYSFRLIE